MAVGAALVLLTGCGGSPKTMSYSELDATRANALNALAQANAAMARVEELESRVDDLESQAGS